jgi:polyisoprenoid-binding protein YceI
MFQKLLFALFFVAATAHAEAPIKVKVTVFPMGSFQITGDKVEGMGAKKGAEYSAKELKVPVDSLKTQMSLRDTHMKKKLESDKYKYITVSNVKAKDGKGTADINIHNVTKPVSFTYKDDGPGKATATFKLHLKDFNLTDINYKGAGVEDEVEVAATVPYK